MNIPEPPLPTPSPPRLLPTGSASLARVRPSGPPARSPSPLRNHHVIPRPPPNSRPYVAQRFSSPVTVARSEKESALRPTSPQDFQSSSDASPPTSANHPARPE